MAKIERHKVKSGVAAGNFGQAGTPLASVRNRVPNVDKLINGLMAGAQGVAQKEQRDNLVSAEAAIREVNMNSGKLNKADRFNKMLEVKNKFKDEGFFLKAFGNENKSVQMIDDLFSRREGQKATAKANTFMLENPDLSADEMSQGVTNILQESGALMKTVSDRASNGYLKSIEGFAIQTEQNINTRQHAKDIAKNVKLSSTTVSHGINSDVEARVGIDTAEVNTKIGTFNKMREYIESDAGKVLMDDMATDVLQFQRETKAITNDTQQTMKLTADKQIELAYKYNMPEFLKVEIKNESGHSTAQHFGVELEAAEVKLRENMLRTRSALESKDRQQVAQGILTRNNAYNAELISLSDIAVSTGDDDAVEEAFDVVDTSQAKTISDYDAGIITDAEFIDRTRINKQQRAKLIDGVGDPDAEDRFTELFVESNDGTAEDFWDLAPLLSKKSKQIASQYLKRLEQNIGRIDAQAFHKKNEANRISERLPFQQSLDRLTSFQRGPNVKHLIDNKAEGVELVPDVAAYSVRLATKTAEAYKAWASNPENGGEGISPTQVKEHTQGIIDEFNAEIKAYEDKLGPAAAADKSVQMNAPGTPLGTINDLAKTGGNLSSNTISAEQSAYVYELADKKIEIPAQTYAAVKTSDFRRRYNKMNVKDASLGISQMLMSVKEDIDLNLLDDTDRNRLAQIFEQSLDKVSVKTVGDKQVTRGLAGASITTGVVTESTLGLKISEAIKNHTLSVKSERDAWGKALGIPQEQLDEIGFIMKYWHRENTR